MAPVLLCLALAMDFQRTIRKPVTMEGVGLHSGERVRLTISPAAADTGILFRASDGTFIPASVDHVVDSNSATTIGAFGMRVRTVEHLMAAAAGLGIDNLLVDVDAEEVPAADGSAKPFVELLQAAGRATLPAPRKPLVVEEPVRVGDEKRWLEILPADSFRISYTLDNSHPAIGLQVGTFAVDEQVFVDELAPARTYGFLKDVGFMRRNGLARGGSLDNAIVLGKRGPLNGLRYPDEFVRHKILDLIGDLALLGRPVIGHVSALNAGHALNLELVKAIQRALGLERRAVATADAATAAPARVPDAFGPTPGLVTI